VLLYMKWEQHGHVRRKERDITHKEVLWRTFSGCCGCLCCK